MCWIQGIFNVISVRIGHLICTSDLIHTMVALSTSTATAAG